MIVVTVACLAPGGGQAQDQKLVEMREIGSRELRSEAFVLESPAELRLRVTGAEPGGLVRFHRTRTAVVRFVRDVLDIPINKTDGPWVANAWILDSRSRNVVWELASADAKSSDAGLRVFDGTLRLPAGTYEIYYATHQPHENNWEYDREASGRLALQILGSNARFRTVTPESARQEFENGVVVGLGRESGAKAERIGFAVDRATDVEVRLLETAAARAGRERAWIIDLDTRRVLWSYDVNASNHAEAKPHAEAEVQTLSLPVGRYAAFHVRNTSYSSGRETTAHDPVLSGLTLVTRDPSARSAVHTFEYEPVTPANVIVSLTRLGNDEARSAGFTLRKPMDVQIFALGESSSGRLVDWGQIVEARTRRPVWTMKFEDTRIAGGSSKNRMFDGTTHLKAGDYLVQFVTDDSHSYDSWNAAEPLDPEFWGITIASASALDRNAVSPYDEANDPAILVRLTGVGDGQQMRRRFTLRNETNIHIYAIGEGDSDTMYDYARIVDASGHTVWQMHYGNTEHAGGSKKNRVFNGTVRLGAGEYEAIYRTDDSHSFGSWNSSPPIDPRNWGITIYR
jgi:hypothetical protein